MLELHHIINSVSAQKVRIALHEKGHEAKEHLMTLAGEADPRVSVFLALWRWLDAAIS